MALENDTQAPDFELPNQFGEHVRLSDFRGRSAVALVFFPLAFSGTCTGELCELRDNLELFRADGVELIGISVDLQSAAQAHPAYQRLSAVDTYIREHYHRPITLDDLTDVAGLSVAQLERYCKRIFHLTPRQMIHKARLEQAHLLLRADLPITEIALRCGYTDHSAFSRQFKTMTGFTPRQYRQATRS